jgi:hypothetical protein
MSSRSNADPPIVIPRIGAIYSVVVGSKYSNISFKCDQERLAISLPSSQIG